MPNDYYNATVLVARQTLARSSAENSDRTLVAAAFDKLPGLSALTQNRITYAVDTGGTNALAVALPTTLTGYTTGLSVSVKVLASNSGASTLNVDSLGAIAIKRIDGTDLEATDLNGDDIATFVYDGVKFIMVSPSRTHMAGMASNLGANLTFTGTPTFSSGVLFTGGPTFSGAPIFSGAPDFSSATNKTTILSDLGVGTTADVVFASVTATDAYPVIEVNDTDASANEKRFQLRGINGGLRHDIISDDGATIKSWMRVGRSGAAFNFIKWFDSSETVSMQLDANGNLTLGGISVGTSAVGTLTIKNGTAPTGSVANGVILYSDDVSASAELRVRDEAGNTTTLSPHNFESIPGGASEDMAWAFSSERDGKRLGVDMMRAMRLIEGLTGEQLVHISEVA